MGDTGFGGGGGYATAMGGRIGMREGGNTTEVVQPAGFIAPDPNATDRDWETTVIIISLTRI